MRLQLAAEACGLIIFFTRVNLGYTESDTAPHINQHLTVGRDNRAATADFGILTERYGGANKVRICIVTEKSIYYGKCFVSIGALMRAAYNYVYVFACKGRKVFIKIEVVAGHKAVSYALDFNNVRLVEFIAVAYVKLIASLCLNFNLTGRGVRFIILTYDITASVYAKGGIPIPRVALIGKICKNYRTASFSKCYSTLADFTVSFCY